MEKPDRHPIDIPETPGQIRSGPFKFPEVEFLQEQRRLASVTFPLYTLYYTAGIIASFLVLSGVNEILTDVTWKQLPVTIIAVSTAVATIMLIRFDRIRKHVTCDMTESKNEILIVAIDKEMFWIKTETGEYHQYRLERLFGACTTPKLIIIFETEYLAHYIPKSAFQNPTDILRIEELLRGAGRLKQLSMTGKLVPIDSVARPADPGSGSPNEKEA